MKVVVAIDSFKGSMTSMEAGNAVKKGVTLVCPEAEVVVKPVADGGEGTAEALVEGLGGEWVPVLVHGPLEKQVTAKYGIIPEKKMAVMEMAEAAGITLVGNEKNPLEATTYGVGEMIVDALLKGCRKFIIGIGGSATNDGGIGMLTALGYEFYDENGERVGIAAKDLKKIAFISDKNVRKELGEASFQIACDVTNPLCGENGATYIFGPQKGVKKEEREALDQAMKHYADVTSKKFGMDNSKQAGAGAAGGMGFAFLSYLKADLQPGIQLVLQAVGLEKALEDADLVFTGEGALDYQTSMGKAPIGIAKLAKKQGAKVIALAGMIGDGASQCKIEGIDAYFPILQKVVTLEEAMDAKNATENMTKTVEQIMRLLTL